MSNGNQAFLEHFDLLIDELREAKGDNRVAIQMMVALRGIYARVVVLEEKSKSKYPTILFLMIERPLEFWPIVAANMLFFAMIFISDSRYVLLERLGIQEDIFTDLSYFGPPLILLLLVSATLAMSRRIIEERKDKEKK